VQPGDAVLVSGDLGRHGVAILAAREELGFRSTLKSDLAPLHTAVQELISSGVEVHCLRDLTRGGLASASDEIARAAGCQIELEEDAIPLHASVNGACELLGLDPLSMANEGRMLVILPEVHAAKALEQLHHHNAAACRVGTVHSTTTTERQHPVLLRNTLGVLRPLDVSRGELLPRIC
jgi:hydrogenase expression/formation protein HypE